ncbi:TetR family transcriptional regulator [Nocardia salmonicida]|uniref:TetR/AcrR family transcriptional regulator n=1 Tax=Nocardia salmonicida TaxID=53431 RepID=UPI0033F7E6C3
MSTDRRVRIVAGAVELIATQGIRALTHRAVDTRLALPPGSTSYYFRTRQALIEAVADGITARSRADFLAAQREFANRQALDPAQVARDIATWLEQLLTHRRNDLIARHALIIEVLSEPELHARLAGSLFSLDRANALFAALGAVDPRASARDFLALLEGLVFDRFAGLRARSAADVDQLARPLADFLTSGRNYQPCQPNSE